MSVCAKSPMHSVSFVQPQHFRKNPVTSLRVDEPWGSPTQTDDYSSSAPPEGSSAASTFENRFMLMAWISAIRCFKVVPSTSLLPLAYDPMFRAHPIGTSINNGFCTVPMLVLCNGLILHVIQVAPGTQFHRVSTIVQKRPYRSCVIKRKLFIINLIQDSARFKMNEPSYSRTDFDLRSFQ